ncbi:hypothetical protein Tco_0767648 [Tanacetum coccineum]
MKVLSILRWFIPNNLIVPKLQTAEDLQGDALLHYDAEMELMNLILLSIPNDIYNSVDIEALISVYNHFAKLMNDLKRNDMHFPIVTIITKFLNSLQPEWLKYVTQVRLGKHLTVDTFDDLFYYLQQFEKLVNVSREKKLEKSHDPLSLVARTSSSSRNTSSYYVTHPTSMVDYEDEYQNNRRAYVQEEIVEGSNAPNETGNVQRTLRTSSSGNTSTDEDRVILTDEQNDFLFDASRMEEIEELSANICLMARI